MTLKRTSNLPAVQFWFEQFQPLDRPLTRKLVDELVYIETSHVLDGIQLIIEEIIQNTNGKVAILPIRELLDTEDSYFSETNHDEIPTLQFGKEPLGSESFISNLVTRLVRNYRNNITLTKPKNKMESYKAPTINALKIDKTKALILVDDLIGSGLRTNLFLNAIYQHKTIKSWVSSENIKINVVSYMATDLGKKALSKNIKKMKASLHVVAPCPTYHGLPKEKKYFELCQKYANKNENHPLGFDKSAVRVFFEHSAPNNLPAIFHKNQSKYRPFDRSFPKLTNRWIGLFPNRSVSLELRRQINFTKERKYFKSAMKEILGVLTSSSSPINKGSLSAITNIPISEMEQYIVVGKKFGMLTEDNYEIAITPEGKAELAALSKTSQSIEFSTENYYPMR